MLLKVDSARVSVPFNFCSSLISTPSSLTQWSELIFRSHWLWIEIFYFLAYVVAAAFHYFKPKYILSWCLLIGWSSRYFVFRGTKFCMQNLVIFIIHFLSLVFITTPRTGNRTVFCLGLSVYNSICVENGPSPVALKRTEMLPLWPAGIMMGALRQ